MFSPASSSPCMSTFHDKLAPSDKHHYWESFNSVKLGVQSGKYQFKKTVRQKISKKPIHSMLRWDVIEKDLVSIKKNMIAPNQEGEIIVEENGQKRVYLLHSENNQGKIRLIPKSGDGIHKLDGKAISEKFSIFMTSSEQDFEKLF